MTCTKDTIVRVKYSSDDNDDVGDGNRTNNNNETQRIWLFRNAINRIKSLRAEHFEIVNSLI